MRAAGHVLTKDFLKEWDEGTDSFAKDPPNATISVLGADGASVEDAAVVLKAPRLDGDKLTCEVAVLAEGVNRYLELVQKCPTVPLRALRDSLAADRFSQAV